MASQKTEDEHVDDAESSDTETENDMLSQLLHKKLNLNPDGPEVEKVLDEVSFDGIIKYITSDKCKNIVVMVGAGISTAAGIPDFRSPSSGLYDNLKEYNLPCPEAIFTLEYFKENPQPFYKLAKELFPEQFKPTLCHYFLRLLHEKGLLLRLYTQNIDTLERTAGIPEDKIIEAHGTFYTSHCLSCRAEYSLSWMKEKVFSSSVPTCEKCNGVVKPDIIFFGEALPEKFFECAEQDFPKCDLLLIMGSSLTVQPFASLVDNVPETTPRCLINKEIRGQGAYVHAIHKMLGISQGLDFDSESNTRDVAWLGLCDDGCMALAEGLGWKDDLLNLMEKEHEKISKESKKSDS